MRFLLIFILLILIFQVSFSEEFQKTKGFLELYKKYLLGFTHTGNKMCFECHMLTLSKEEYEKKFSGCICHDIEDIRGSRKYEIDMGALSRLHGVKHCIRCHTGGGSKVNKYIFHLTIHRLVNCTRCHGMGSMIYVKDLNCFNCHEKNIHYIHSRILNELCSFCHSKVFAKEYTEEELKRIGFNVTKGVERKVVKEYEGPTILKIIYSIINFILSILK